MTLKIGFLERYRGNHELEAIQKSRHVKYIRRIPKKSGKGWYYIYENSWKHLLTALFECFGIGKKKIDETYTSDIKEKYGASKTTWAAHVLEYFTNKEKWDNLFSKKEKRDKYKKPVTQKAVEEKTAAAVAEKKETPKAKNSKKMIINRSLMRKVWSIFSVEGQRIDKEEITKNCIKNVVQNSEKVKETETAKQVYAMLNDILEKNQAQTIDNPELGEISVEAGETGKSGWGLKHIIEQRYTKDGKNEEEIAALILLVIDSASNGNLTRENNKLYELEKNGIIALVRKKSNDKKEKWVLTGFENWDKQEEATDAIKTVNAQYGYLPEYSHFRNQVGAVIASLGKNNTNTENVNNEHGNKTAMLGNQNAKKDFTKADKKQVLNLLSNPTDEMLKIEYTRDNYNNLFPRGNIETPIGKVKLGEHQFERLGIKDDGARKNLLGAMYQTLKNPTVIINEVDKENREAKVYIKTFKDESGTIAIVVDKDGENISVSFGKRKIKQIENKIKMASSFYYKAESGSPTIGTGLNPLPNQEENIQQSETNVNDETYSLNPNAKNYAYKDTGYIAGSQREKVQITLKRKAEAGETVNIDDVDWNALEENSRTAAQLITKDNIIGKIDYQKMKDKGIDSKAAAMITSIYRSIGKEPVDNTPEGRKNFVWAISTLRERLESCKTYEEVFAMIKEIGEEKSGKYTTLLSMDSEYGELETQYNNIINSQKEINRKIINNNNLNRKFKNKEERTKYWQDFLKKEYPWLDEFKISYGYYRSPYENVPYISIEETKKNELLEKQKATRKVAVEKIELANPMFSAWKQLGDKCLDAHGCPAKSIFDYYNAFKILELNGSFCSQKDRSYAKYLNWGWEGKTKKEQSSIVKGRVKRKFEMAVPDKYERIGGRNVSVDSSQELKEAYNFRDVQVGTWVQTDVASAKWHTDNINEGFADLCDITGIPDNLVSMNGRIAIAIGARGVKGAKAHYEPGERVIQINKMQGGGSLGHEWFHAFDNLISEAINGGDYNEWFTWQGKDQIKMASPSGKNKSSVKQVVSNNNDSLSQKVRDKFTNLVNAMMEGDTPETNTVEFDEEKWNKCQSFYNLKTKIGKYKPRTLNAAQTFEDAKKIIDEYYDDRITREKDYQSRGYTAGMSVEKLTQEKIKSLEFAAIKFADKEKGETEYLTGRIVSRYYQDAKKLGNGYWDTPHEMAARAFQCWLNDKLKEQGRKNTYLVGMVDNDVYQDEFYPFPTERDRKKINKVFDELFEVIRSENAIRKAMLFEESVERECENAVGKAKIKAENDKRFGRNNVQKSWCCFDKKGNLYFRKSAFLKRV